MFFWSNQKMKRAVTQDDWKRSQVRMPQEQYDRIMDYAEKKNISLNTAMLELMDKGLNPTLVMSKEDSGLFEKIIKGIQQMEQKQSEIEMSIKQIQQYQK